MQLLLCYSHSSIQIYHVPNRYRSKKNIATFPTKRSSSYLEYSVDFGRWLQRDERVISGKVGVQGLGLNIETVVCKGSYVTAYIDRGLPNYNYYLTYEAHTNLGNVYTQEMILPVFGKAQPMINKYSYLSCTEQINPPDKLPPLNGLKINDRYLLNSSGFFMVI